jgi:hypothetical protein
MPGDGTLSRCGLADRGDLEWDAVADPPNPIRREHVAPRRKREDGTWTTEHVPPEVAIKRNRAKDQARATAKRRPAVELRTLRDEQMWRYFTIAPRTVDLAPFLTRAEIDHLRAAAPKMFHKNRKGLVRHPDVVLEDTSFIFDLLKNGEPWSSGQQRRMVLSPSALHHKVEGTFANRPGFNHLILGDDYFSAENRHVETLITRVGAAFAAELRVTNQSEYPLGPSDVEMLMTPAGAPPQEPHQDTHQDMANVLVYFDFAPNDTFLSTHVAVNDTFAGDELPSEVQYHRVALKASEGYPLEALVMHATWPHFGPGNMTGKKARYVLFYSFPLSEAAAKRSTAENVYHAPYFTTPITRTTTSIATSTGTTTLEPTPQPSHPPTPFNSHDSTTSSSSTRSSTATRPSP